MDGEDMAIEREKGPFKWNLNSVLAVSGAAVTIITQVVVFAILWTNQTRDVQDLQNQVTTILKRFDTEAAERKDRLRDYQGTLNDMQGQIATIAPLSFQVTSVINSTAENKEAIKQTNSRIDRVVESFGGKLDTVLDAVNKLTTRVEVLATQQQEEKRTNKTSFERPIYRP